MKVVSDFRPAFRPASRELDFSGMPGFRFRRLYAVINLAAGAYRPIYAIGAAGLGATNSGTVLTLVLDTTAMKATDPLMVIYEDGATLPGLGPAPSAKAMPVVVAADSEVVELLTAMLVETRVTNLLLALIGNIPNADVTALREDFAAPTSETI
jgi:hypothetical protein